MIIIGTFSACIISYEIIRRVTLLRPLFGLKWNAGKSQTNMKVPGSLYRIRTALAYILVLPLAVKLLIF
jgi:hypothetical protein